MSLHRIARRATRAGLGFAVVALAASTALAAERRFSADPASDDNPRLAGYQGSRLVDPGRAVILPDIPPEVAAHDPNAGGCRAAYFRCNFAPWGHITNETAMNRVFGAGNWDTFTYESNNITPFGTTPYTYDFIFMEGGDGCASELNSYLAAHRVTRVEPWVTGGGGLFINGAPNEGGNQTWPFGATLVYPDFGGANVGNIVNPAHPIVQGPFLPTGTSWTGTSHTHASILNGGTTVITQGDGSAALSERSQGTGFIMYGGMTTDGWHAPQPQASNVRANIIHYIDDRAAACGAAPPGGGDCDLTPIEAKLDDGLRFTSDAERTTQTNTLVSEINQNETRIQAVEAKLDDGNRWINNAELAAVHLDLDTDIAAVEAKLDGFDLTLLDTLVRIEIEHALGEDVNAHKPMAIFMLPASAGGRLEQVADIVDRVITGAEAAGCQVGAARAYWTAANAEYALGHWDQAYVKHHQAYEAAVAGPCN